MAHFQFFGNCTLSKLDVYRAMQLFNLPNKITLIRIFLTPVIVVLLHFEDKNTCLIAAFCFTLASISDLIDGYIARRSNMVTSIGKFLDPLADKVLISSVLIMLVKLGWVEAWIAVVIICRDLIVTGLRAVAVDEGVVIAADKFGKLKTILQMLAVIPLMLHYECLGFSPILLGEFLLYIALLLTVFSGANYMYKFYQLWAERHKGPKSTT